MSIHFDEDLTHIPPFAFWEEAKPLLEKLYDGKCCRFCGGTAFGVSMGRKADANTSDPVIPQAHRENFEAAALITVTILVSCERCGSIDLFEASKFERAMRGPV